MNKCATIEIITRKATAKGASREQHLHAHTSFFALRADYGATVQLPHVRAYTLG